MRIRIHSDLHLEHQTFAPPPAPADLVVLAGDIANGAAGVEWARSVFREPVIYLSGNHEYYEGEFGAVQEAILEAARRCSVDVLDCGERIAGGVRFLGCTLWTDYSLSPPQERPAVIEASREQCPDYQLIRYGSRTFAPEDAIALCVRHRSWLAAKLAEPFSGSTVVVTHFAPHPFSIAPAFLSHPANPGFVLDLSDLMGRAGLWIHGHTHTFFDYRVRGTRVVCNPRGYPGEPTGFLPNLTVEI